MYDLWMRLSRVLEESVEKLDTFCDTFPKDVAYAKTFASELSSINFDSKVYSTNDIDKIANIVADNGERLDYALTSFGEVIDRVTQCVEESTQAVSLISKKKNT